MSRYDDTFRDLLYQLNEAPAKPTDKCPKGHVWNLKDGKWSCIKKAVVTTHKDTWDRGGLNEAQAPTIPVDPGTWDDNFANLFVSDTIDKAPDRDTWGDKAYTISVDSIPWDVYDVQSEDFTGVIIPDPDEAAMVHFFPNANSQYLARLLTGQ